MTLRTLHLGSPDEADMACHLVQTAKEPSQRLLQVFLEAVCSEASIELAMSQLQRYHDRAWHVRQAYDRLLYRISPGGRHTRDDDLHQTKNCISHCGIVQSVHLTAAVTCSSMAVTHDLLLSPAYDIGGVMTYLIQQKSSQLLLIYGVSHARHCWLLRLRLPPTLLAACTNNHPA